MKKIVVSLTEGFTWSLTSLICLLNSGLRMLATTTGCWPERTLRRPEEKIKVGTDLYIHVASSSHLASSLLFLTSRRGWGGGVLRGFGVSIPVAHCTSWNLLCVSLHSQIHGERGFTMASWVWISLTLSCHTPQSQPFTSLLMDTLFNMSRFLLHKLMTDSPKGVSRLYPTHTHTHTHCYTHKLYCGSGNFHC